MEEQAKIWVDISVWVKEQVMIKEIQRERSRKIVGRDREAEDGAGKILHRECSRGRRMEEEVMIKIQVTKRVEKKAEEEGKQVKLKITMNL